MKDSGEWKENLKGEVVKRRQIHQETRKEVNQRKLVQTVSQDGEGMQYMADCPTVLQETRPRQKSSEQVVQDACKSS